MAVQARFYVAEVTLYPDAAGYAAPKPRGKVIMRPVTRGEDNAPWASATPSGLLEMTVHGGALPWFQDRLGQEIAITLDDTPAHTALTPP